MDLCSDRAWGSIGKGGDADRIGGLHMTGIMWSPPAWDIPPYLGTYFAYVRRHNTRQASPIPRQVGRPAANSHLPPQKSASVPATSSFDAATLPVTVSHASPPTDVFSQTAHPPPFNLENIFTLPSVPEPAPTIRATEVRFTTRLRPFSRLVPNLYRSIMIRHHSEHRSYVRAK